MHEHTQHRNASASEAVIRLSRPAAEWIEGFPLANGISAVMVWGGSSHAVLSLNHVDFWRHNLKQEEPEAWPDLHAARELMLAGRAAEANDVYDQRFVPHFRGLMPSQQPDADPGITGYTNIFSPIGDLVIEWDGDCPSDGIRRQLDFRDGIASAAWPCGAGEATWESFVPAREDVIVFVLHSPVPLSGRLRFERKPQPSYTLTQRILSDGLLAQGEYPEGVRSVCQAQLEVGNGTLTPDSSADAVLFSDVYYLQLYVAVEAGQGDRDLAADCARKMTAAIAHTVDDIRRAHQAEHRSFFDRASFRLDSAETNGDTDRLLDDARNGDYAPRLAELSFQFGRYLMMACNRAGRRPANLQGIWNRDPATPWDADWHTDMNVQMAHWLCNPTHLDECNLALFRQFDTFMEAGRRMARQVAGCEGILWYLAGGDGMAWVEDHCCGFWVGAASWIAQHYWTHYEYTQDRDFLEQRAYPLLREVGLFWKSWMRRSADGFYRTGFSFSPENTPTAPENQRPVQNVEHTTMDTALVREVMRHLLEGGRLLNRDCELWPVWQELHDRVLPYPVNADGQLKEWPEPWIETPGHRHFSHLYLLFPGDEFTAERTPDLFEAARRAVLLREAHRVDFTNWSCPYAVCFDARLGDGNAAERDLALLSRNSVENLLAFHNDWGWGYRLFQIEANLGITAAIAEMLLQSHAGVIRLLPALPGRWPSGSFAGLKARGAFVVDAEWREGRLTSARIRSLQGLHCRVRCGIPWDGLWPHHGAKPLADVTHEDGCICFPTLAGAVYEWKPISR